MMVIVPTMGNTMELVAPVSLPPFATTSANSPPEDDRPTAVRTEVILSMRWALAERNTVMNLALMETAINTIAGTINTGISLKSIKAPTDTKNMAAKISLTGVAKTLVTE